MEYKEQNNNVKKIIIELAKNAGYGAPEYTNMNEIDYKFWEDSDYETSVIILAQKIDEMSKKMFTVEQFKKYCESQDSFGDIFYNLKKENIVKANQEETD